MKKQAAAIQAICLFSLLIRGPGALAQRHTNRLSSCCSVVTDALTTVGRITKGSTRADVEREFRVQGGLFSRQDTIYVYRRCPQIGIRVTFLLDPSYRDFATGSPKDTVVSVSQPFIGYEVTD
jgi:hypothetical protein